jgi:hypothetical protein
MRRARIVALKGTFGLVEIRSTRWAGQRRQWRSTTAAMTRLAAVSSTERKKKTIVFYFFLVHYQNGMEAVLTLVWAGLGSGLARWAAVLVWPER